MIDSEVEDGGERKQEDIAASGGQAACLGGVVRRLHLWQAFAASLGMRPLCGDGGRQKDGGGRRRIGGTLIQDTVWKQKANFRSKAT